MTDLTKLIRTNDRRAIAPVRPEAYANWLRDQRIRAEIEAVEREAAE